MMGGGRCYFTPNTTSTSCRHDGIDAFALARDLGYSVFTDRAGFDAKQKLPYLGLFAEDHMSYEIDRDPKVQPSLKEMALKGIDDLYSATKDSDEGFFVLVEASRIDHAGHANDAVGHLHDILAYNSAMLAMREWVDEHQEDSPTVLISTADHECGGLTVGVIMLNGAPDYWFAPEHFSTAKATPGPLAKLWKAYSGATPKDYLKTTIFATHGIASPTERELTQGLALKNNTAAFQKFLSTSMSIRLGVNWSTIGHTGADVTLYGWGKGSEEFAGSHENTEVGHFVAQQLGLDLEKTQGLLRRNESWEKKWVRPPVTKKKVARRSLAQHHH